MRTLSTSTNTRASANATQPGYLLEIPFSYYIRYSTRGVITWDAAPPAAPKVFVPADFQVSGITWDGTAGQTGQVVLNDLTNSLITTILAEDVAGRPINIWMFYEGAVATADPVALFQGTCDDVTIDPSTSQVTLAIMGESLSSLHSPRRFISPPDFNFLPPTGTTFTFGGQKYQLERG